MWWEQKSGIEAQPGVSLLFLRHFDVSCDLMLSIYTNGNMESICFIFYIKTGKKLSKCVRNAAYYLRLFTL